MALKVISHENESAGDEKTDYKDDEFAMLTEWFKKFIKKILRKLLKKFFNKDVGKKITI